MASIVTVLQDNAEVISVGLLKWLLGGMTALILILIAWIKSLLAENKELANAYIQDLKDRNKAVTRQNTPPAIPKPTQNP